MEIGQIDPIYLYDLVQYQSVFETAKSVFEAII